MNLRRISERSLPELPTEVWWVIAVNAAMSVIFNFVGIFVNLYWWNQGHSIFQVSLFNLFATVALFASYLVGSHYLWRRDIRFVMLLSSVFSGVTFLALFFYVPDLRNVFTAAVGMAFGLTQGFFWAANNSAMYTFLKSEQYADYFSVNTVLGQAIAIIVPLASAGIVGLLGFRETFLAMLCFVVAAFLVSMRIPHRGLHENLYQHRRWREVFAKPGTVWLMPAVFCSGVIAEFLMLFSLIFIFTVSHTGSIVALLNIGYSLALLGALTLYRRSILTQESWIGIGIVLIMASFVTAFSIGGRGVWDTLVVLLMQVGGLYLSGASGRQQYRVLLQGDVVQRTRLGLWMEVPYLLSRCVVLIGGLFVHRVSGTSFITLAIIATAAMIGVPWFTRRAVAAYEAVHGVGSGL